VTVTEAPADGTGHVRLTRLVTAAATDAHGIARSS
jgi:hypothetical protein